MKVEDLLKLIDQHNAETGETDKALSLRSGLSGEGIRNWRRSIKSGKTPGANAGSIDKVLRAIGKSPMHDDVVHTVPARIEEGDDAPEGAKVIRAWNVKASAGYGSLVDIERVEYSLAFPPDYMRRLTSTNPAELAIIGVVGDSMEPTLKEDNIVMVDRTKRDIDFDGMFVVRIGNVLKVKRAAWKVRGQVVRITSDNSTKYPPEEFTEGDEFEVIGRVIWAGGKV